MAILIRKILSAYLKPIQICCDQGVLRRSTGWRKGGSAPLTILLQQELLASILSHVMIHKVTISALCRDAIQRWLDQNEEASVKSASGDVA